MVDHRTDDSLATRIQALCGEALKPRPTGARARLQPLGGIKAVLFDVYGTLLISASGDIGILPENAQEEALQEALASLGLFPPTGGEAAPATAKRGVALLLENIAAAHASRRSAGVDHPEVEIREIWTTVLARLAQEGLLDQDLSEEAIEQLAVEYECRVNPVWTMPGLERMLSTLKERGLVMGIVSNSQFYTPLTFVALCGQTLKELGFEAHFCSWSYEELEAKPSRRLFESVLDRMEQSTRILPGETLYVGNDVLKDIRPASRAGCRTALFAGDERSLRWREDDPRCRDLRPDLVLTELGQLPECLV